MVLGGINNNNNNNNFYNKTFSKQWGVDLMVIILVPIVSYFVVKGSTKRQHNTTSTSNVVEFDMKITLHTSSTNPTVVD